MTNCEVCESVVKVENTLAGAFDRICKKCNDDGLDDLAKPLCLIKEGMYIGSELASRNEALLK